MTARGFPYRLLLDSEAHKDSGVECYFNSTPPTLAVLVMVKRPYFCQNYG